MAALLILVNVLPQFMAAGYKDVFPLMSLSGQLLKWVYPILQLLMILGVGWTMTAPRASKVMPWGVVCLLFTTLVYLWPSVVYLGNLPSSWLNGSGVNFGYPSIVPFIQAWLFTGMLAQLASWAISNGSNASSTFQKTNETEKQGWEKASSGLRFLLVAGGVWLAVWLALYYLPAFLPSLSRFYMRFFRLWMMLPQIGVFGIMVLLAMFSRPATRVLRLMKHQVIDEASSSSEDAANNSSNRTASLQPVVIILTGLALASYASFLASQKWLAPAYTNKQLEKLKTNLEELNEQFQKANAEPISSIGTTAPNLMLQPLEGDAIPLESLRGKVVVLNFCATNLPTSTVEMLRLEQIANQQSKESVEIIGISAEPKPTLEAYSKQKKITYRLVSGKNWPAPFNSIRVTPTTYIIDPKGVIRERLVGMQPLNKLTASIDKILASENKQDVQ
jgi:peroxiredoxin